ncbi:MAG: hypothetical protein O4803_01940 [Trichodesmium sp. St15_bin1_1]|nr:hypothetical protein [Trichodesmium sp. MAG_R02]MDE5080396.1 hypothetical protein [Trichodesmium sp. St18_bin1]MDE5089441.1 hypothetical protein [Trichodesmium sp. St16_bin2-tuft]MDE5113063.1 hypothetical protein [Trichodesmium sp. St15_bin1_1]MDE5124462.1 hypothetical protein [Trichodesmium sp. St19_bin1]
MLKTSLILNLKLKDYLIIAMHKGSSVVRVVKEVGSGVNDNRPLVVKL